MKLHVVIPARREYPQLVWTVYSLINDVNGVMPFDVTVVSNDADAETRDMDAWFSKGTLSRRGYLTVRSTEEAVHPYVAIHQASETFDDGLLLFCCGHMAVQRGTVAKLARLASDTGGYCHSPMLYMGDFPDKSGKSKLYGYKDPVKRGWSWKRMSDKPYMWSGGGGGLTCVTLDTWRSVGGADAPFRRGIGGIEEYMDMKMWMFGKSVWIHPDCLYFHWAKTRGYTWKMHEHYWNQLVGAYCLTNRRRMEELNAGFSYPQPDSVLDEVEQLCKRHREWVQSHRVFSRDEVLKLEPWLQKDELQRIIL
jgi:hypothetical protein